MTLRALVIDDDPHIADVVSDIVASLGHASDAVGCQDDARRKLAMATYDYFVLDLEIPVRAERSVARLQNGLNLLSELVAARVGPVIVVTGFGNHGPDQGVECVKLGAADYIAKPFKTEGKTLDWAITEALRKSGRLPAVSDMQKPASPPRPFAGGEIQLLKKRLVVCGVEVPITPLMQKILTVLSEKNAAGKYAAFSGEELAEHGSVGCGRGQNGVSDAIHQLRKRITTSVLDEANMAVGDQDIIRSKGLGYRIAESVTVVSGARRTALVTASHRDFTDAEENVTNHVTVHERNGTNDVTNVTNLNDRQAWAMSVIRKGQQVRVSMLVTQFKCSTRTAKRDLADLKELGVVRFVGSPRTGHYILT
ncbi:MAG: response regulator [Planctomycetota bacterium]|nr:MAG: response regulator [Planctomycetota bacterium]